MFSLLKRRNQRKAQQATLLEDLIPNLWQDALFQNFPHIESLRETVMDEDTRYEIRVDPVIHDTISIIVYEDDDHVGTLTYHSKGRLYANAFEHKHFKEVTTSHGIDRLYEKIMRLNELDNARRTMTVHYEPAPAKTPAPADNVIPFPGH